MTITKLNSKGFGGVEALLIVIIIAILGGVGYYVYDSSSKADEAYSSAVKSSQSTPAKAGKKAEPAKSSQKYLTIKEWGVKFKLNSQNADASYTSKPDGVFSMYLSSKAMDDFASKHPECSALSGSISISRYKPGDNGRVQGPWTEEDLKNTPGSVKIGDYYFIDGAGQACFGDASDEVGTQALELRARLPGAADLVSAN